MPDEIITPVHIINVEELKSYIDLNTNDYDDTLNIFINGLEEFLIARLGRTIAVNSFTEYFNGDDIKDLIFLSNIPITKFTSLKYRQGTITAPTWTDLDPDSYQVDEDTGIIYINQGIGGALYLNSSLSGIRNIEAKYDAGFDTIPNPLKIATLKLANKLWNKRHSDGFSDEEALRMKITWDKFMSSDIEELINPYRRIKI